MVVVVRVLLQAREILLRLLQAKVRQAVQVVVQVAAAVVVVVHPVLQVRQVLRVRLITAAMVAMALRQA